MPLTRRSFLQMGCLGLAASLTGCNGNNGSTGIFDPRLLEHFPGYRKPLLDPALAQFRIPQGRDFDLTAHLLNRLTFGFRARDYTAFNATATRPSDNDYTESEQAWIEQQLNPSGLDDAPINAVLRQFDILAEPMPELYEYKEQVLLRELTSATLLRAVYSERQLLELMVHFWSDHFNVASSKGECKWLIASQDRDVIRPHALGSFPDLLRAVALSPAMLWYLDGRVNKKKSLADKPNENYARELLELHTLGVHGGYSQHDVMEVARCLTGWTVRDRFHLSKGKVAFNHELHDDGSKEVLGQTIPAGLGEGDSDHKGDFDRVVDIVALHPETARHLATKLCQRFIADDAPAGAVKAVSDAFLSSKGDIAATMRALIHTPEFRANRANKFRRPFEFIAAVLRATEAITDGGTHVCDYLPRMGHAPFQYPTPDGYPITANRWMGTLLWRWNFVVALTENRLHGTKLDREGFLGRCPNPENFPAALIGRQPNDLELDPFKAVGVDQKLALILASPALQMC